MPKWKKDAKEFSVSLRYDDKAGIALYLPKPVAELLGNPSEIIFVKKGKRLEVRGGGATA